MTDSDDVDKRYGHYRRLYSNFIRGRRINQVPMDAEAYFWRVLVIVDDFGNTYGDLNVLFHSTAGARKAMTVKHVERWCAQLADAGLFLFYENGGERFLHILNFELMQPAISRNRKRRAAVPKPPSELVMKVRESRTETHQGAERCNRDSQGATGSDRSHRIQNTEIETETENLFSSSQPNSNGKLKGDPKRIFMFWQDHLNHPRAILDAKRRRKIEARLREGFTEEQLLNAIRGCRLSPHNMGENERGTVYDDIDLICRDASHVERFMGIYNNGATLKRKVIDTRQSATDRRTDRLRGRDYSAIAVDSLRRGTGDNGQT